MSAVRPFLSFALLFSLYCLPTHADRPTGLAARVFAAAIATPAAGSPNEESGAWPTGESWAVRANSRGLAFSFGTEGTSGNEVSVCWLRRETALPLEAFTLRRQEWHVSAKPVRQREVFPGVDVFVHGRQGVPEFDFEVAPAANVAAIAYRFEKGAQVSLVPGGALEIVRDGRRFVQRPPLAWQDVEGRQVAVEVSFVLDRDGAVSFRTGDYRRDLPLVIDPTVEFSTYLSREGDPRISPLAMAKAPNGDIFLLASSGSTDFPEQGAYHVPYPDQTPGYVLARIHGTTYQLLSRTVLPRDDPFDSYNSALLTVDGNGSPWVVIPSNSAKVPAMNPSIGTVSSSTARGRRRALLVRLSPDASTITYSAYVGCTNDVRFHSLDAGPDSSVVLAASSTCSDFPTTAGAFQHQHLGTYFGPHAGILKLDASTGTVRYGTYFGAFTQSVIPDLRAAVDHSGRVVVAATAYSDQLPATPGVLGQPAPESASIYAGALSADGSHLEFGTYFGSPSFDRFLGLAIGEDDSIYVSGLPGSGFPTTPGAFIAPGESRAYFVSRLAKDGKTLLYSSLPLRGQMEGIHTHLAVMQNGDAVIATEEADLGMMTSTDAFTSWQQGFGVVRLSADGTTVRFASALPSKYGATPRAILALDSGNVALAGQADPGHVVRSANAWTSIADSAFAAQAKPGFLTLIDLDSPTICSIATQLSRNPAPSGRSTGLLTVNTSPGCPWLVEENAAPVLRFRSLPGMVGPGTVEYDTEPNLQRTPVNHELRVGKGSYPFTQEAGTCDFFEILPELLSFPAAGGYRSVDARAVEWCGWSVGASSAWFVNPDETPSGGLSPYRERLGQATLSVAAPVNAFGPRSGIAVLGGKQLTITQEGGACTASLSPLSLNVPVSGTETNLTLQTTGVGCEWLAVGGPGVEFPAVRAGSGSAVVPIRIQANPSNTTRQTHVWLANKMVEITQAAGQCSAMFPQPVTEVPHVGGGVMLPVEATGDACGWNATVNQNWLRFESSPSAGSGYMSLFVEPNLSGVTREATISNLGKTATIRQAGNDTAFVQFQIPSGIGLKINGVYEAEPAPRTYPHGTTLTLEPDAYRTQEPNILDEVTGWRDWPEKNRTITLNSNNVVLELVTRRLVRLAVEKTPGGTVDIQVAGTPSSTYPEFYISTGGQSSLSYRATARPAAGYLFYGWQKPDRNEYLPGPELRESDGLGWYLRPRFERMTPPAGVYFVPELLELVVYTNFAPSTHRFEIIAADGPVFGPAGAPCSDGIEGIRTAGFGPVGQRTMLIFEPSPDGLRASGRKTVECTFNVRGGPNSSVYSFPIRFTIEGAAVTPPPPPPSGSVAISHAADFSPTPLAPGGLFSLFAPDLANTTITPSTLPLPSLLAGVQLRIYSETDFATRYAELLYVSPTQVNFFVPEDLPTGSARVQQYKDGKLIREIPMPVARSAPGIFRVGLLNGGPAPAGYGVLVSRGRQYSRPIYQCPGGQCVLQYLDMGGTQDQLYLTIYGTGLRGLRLQDLAFTVNGIALPVEYLGAHGYFVGLDQVNLRVPRSLIGAGDVRLELRVGSKTVQAGRLLL